MRIIVLNKDYSYINDISVKRAFCLLEKGKVIVEKWSDKTIRGAEKIFQIPLIVRLIILIKNLYRKKVKWTKSAVFIRDNYTCQYCGTKNLRGKSLTVDHIIPKTKGGKNTFENTLTACRGCNNYKGDKTMEEVGLYFYDSSFKAYHPSFMDFIRLKNPIQYNAVNELLMNQI